MTDYKKLCAELVEKIEYTWGSGVPADVRELLKRARAALADETAWRRTWETTQTGELQ